MNANKKIGVRTLVVIVAVAVLLFGGISITNAAAKAAIPGDALYPVKTSFEQTRLILAQNAGNRSQLKMGFAEERLTEIGKLIAEGRNTEIRGAVLAFESEINGAILELETLAKTDPSRAAALAQEITSTLTRYATTLSTLAASAPDSVRDAVTRALDTTQFAGSLEMPSDDNANSNDDNSNENGNTNDDNSNANDDNSNGIDDNSNGIDDNSNSNTNDDNSNTNDDNSNGIDDNSNTNTNDDSSNANTNTNDDSSGRGGGGGGGGDDNVNDNGN